MIQKKYLIPLVVGFVTSILFVGGELLFKRLSMPPKIEPPITIYEHCGGNIRNPNVCPAGYDCVPDPNSGGLPFGDVGGICVPRK